MKRGLQAAGAEGAGANLNAMKRTLVSIVAALAVLAPIAASPAAVAEPGPGYFASPNVEWITNIPIETDSAGARLLGKYLYITTGRGLAIYDVSKPEAPVRTGFLLLPQEPQFAEEDVDTNGKILLVETLGELNVVDVEDKSNPVVIGKLETSEHTVTCVLQCRWAYGSSGKIYDLRKPANPKEAGSWMKGTPVNSSHDVTEVAPGMIMTSSQPLMLLDARKNPAKPKPLAFGGNKDSRFIHSNIWPHKMKDKFLLVGGETVGNCDDEQAGAFMVWDATTWKKNKTFKMIDDFHMKNGLPTDGDALANTFCSHWFETQADFKNGGMVAMAWYEHGTRFLNVSSKGKISEKGYFLPVGGATSGAYWITDRILYAVDYQRGIDIIKYTGKL